MKRLASIFLCMCWFIQPAVAQQIKLSAIPVTNGIAGADLTLLDTSIGGGNYVTRTVAFSNWFNTQIFLPSAVFVSGGIGSTFWGPKTMVGDSTPNVASDPFTSGSFWTARMESTNAADGFPFGTNLQGWYDWDAESMSIGAVGLQTVEANYPGFNLWVGNGEPTAIAFSAGTVGNIPYVMFDSGGPQYHGGTSGDTMVYFPYLTNTTAHRFFTSTFRSAGTNTESFPADGLKAMVVMDESQGTFNVAGGGMTLNGNFTDSNKAVINFSQSGSSIEAPIFLTATTGGYFNAGGTTGDGWSFLDGPGTITARIGNVKELFINAGSVQVPFALTGAFDLGLTNGTFNNLWANVWHTDTKTNTFAGFFVLNGATGVNVGNTAVTSDCNILITEQSAHGGTQSGQVFVTSITPGTGFAVKSVALDTSICYYELRRSYSQ